MSVSIALRLSGSDSAALNSTCTYKTALPCQSAAAVAPVSATTAMAAVGRAMAAAAGSGIPATAGRSLTANGAPVACLLRAVIKSRSLLLSAAALIMMAMSSSAQAASGISDVISISQTVQFLVGELIMFHQRLIFYANNFMFYAFSISITLSGIRMILRNSSLSCFAIIFIRHIMIFGIVKFLIISSDLIPPDLITTALRLGGDNAMVSGDISTVIAEIFALIEDYARSIINTNVIFFFIFVSIIYICILVLVVYYILLFINVYLSCSFGMFTMTFAVFRTTRPIAWSFMLHLLGLLIRIAGMSAMICMSLEVISTLMIKLRYAAIMGQIISVQDAGLVCLLVVLTTAACIYAPGRLAGMVKNAPLYFGK